MSKKKQVPFEMDGNRCWMCGEEFDGDKTKHHAIPHTFKPILNVLIPICRPCHEKIHKEMLRVEGVKTKLTKIKKELNQFEIMLFKK